jgi:predicted ArsR family transcriptional regulator
VSKATPAEMARRRDAVAKLYREGYQLQHIATALGISPSAVSDDLLVSGTPKVRGPRPKGDSVPPTTKWREADQPVQTGPHYLSSLALNMVDNTTEYFTRQDAVNLLAHDAHDALVAGDEAWVSQARAKLSRLMSYLGRMQAVLDSPEARARGMQIDQTERPDLRVVR